MKSPISQKFDSDHIRQGLISIRNTQLELLNELKHQTQILKHYSPPSTTSQLSSRTSNQKKIDRFPSFSIEGKMSMLENDSKIRLQSSELSSWNEKQLKDEINYLKNQNKLANSNFQKMKRSMQSDKDKINELQSSLNFVSKLYYDILLQILDERSINQIQQFINGQYAKISQQNGQLKAFVDDIKMLINQIQKKREETNKIKNKTHSEKDIANQLIDLKSQISILISQTHQGSNVPNQLEISKIKEQVEEKNHIIEQLEGKLKKLQAQNKQISRFWDKQLSERKKVMLQLENLRKQTSKWEQKQKKIIFYAKDMESKALKSEKLLKDKEKSQILLKENCNKLTQTLNSVRESNQSLRLEVKSLQQNKQKRYISLSQQKRQLQNEFKMFSLQKQKLIENKDTELQSLRNYLLELKKNQESLKQFERKSKDGEIMQQDIYWKKVNIIRTNSTIDHLWQVKEVEYENINELLKKMKK